MTDLKAVGNAIIEGTIASFKSNRSWADKPSLNSLMTSFVLLSIQIRIA